MQCSTSHETEYSLDMPSVWTQLTVGITMRSGSLSGSWTLRGMDRCLAFRRLESRERRPIWTFWGGDKGVVKQCMFVAPASHERLSGMCARTVRP